MKISSGAISLLVISVLAAGVTCGGTQVEPETALKMLNNQNQQFEQKVVKVADSVYTAVGFHGANTSMIVGDDGVIIIDTLKGPNSAAKALQAFREYSDKPVKAIIYTHSHADHIGGASAFAVNAKPDIYATAGFGSAEGGINKDVNPVKGKRNVRQFGRKLPPDQQTNRGVAPAGTDDTDGGNGFIPPTIRVSEDGYKVRLAGIELEFYLSPGETDDALLVWMPNEKVLFAGDNFYSSFPDLYTIRGTAYRDVLDWSESVAKMAAFNPQVLVPGHTVPILDGTAAVAALKDYSEAIRSVYDQTVEGINAGKSPDQIAHEVKLPAHLKDQPYLIEFYGTVPHAVRSIYTGLLGWYDGNPTTLNPLEPKLKALRALAAREYNAPNRNYYLSYANELESGQLSEVWF